MSARVRSATKSPRLSESRRSTSDAASGSTATSRSLREAASAVARASSPSFLRELPAKLERAPARAPKAWAAHVHHGLSGRGQPLRQVPAEAASVLHRPAALGEPLGPTFEGPQAGSVLREVGTLEELAGLVHRRDGDGRLEWGSTLINTFMRTSDSVGSLPSARAKDIPTSGRAHTSFESLRTPFSTAGRKPRTSQPILRATGSSRAIPVTRDLEA